MLLYLTILTFALGKGIRWGPCLDRGATPVCGHQTNGIPQIFIHVLCLGQTASTQQRSSSRHPHLHCLWAQYYNMGAGRMRTRIYPILFYEALEDESTQVCYNSIMHVIIPPQSVLYHQSCSTINQLRYRLHSGNIAPMCCLKAHGCNTLHLTLQ